MDAVIGGILKSCELLAEKPVNKADLKAIGIGVPGMMNVDTGEVIFCPNLRSSTSILQRAARKVERSGSH